jgi:predicted nucleic acid-binding protein
LSDIAEGPVALDTAIFIYFLEAHPVYRPLVVPVFAAIDRGELIGVTSTLTLMESLVVPLRAGNLPLAERYETLLTESHGLAMVDVDLDLLRAAAYVRAATRAKTPDAIQAATALVGGCSVFLTNDNRFPALPGLRVLALDDYLPLSS